MKTYCESCNKEYDCNEIKCPVCGVKLKTKYAEIELKEIQKQNDDFTVINTLIM